MKHVKMCSRDNARQPLDWGEFITQEADEKSVLNIYRKLSQLWHDDPVLINGDFKLRKATKKGVLEFDRSYDGECYKIHIDLSGKTKSYCKDSRDSIIVANR